jgi:hypothetical protein
MGQGTGWQRDGQRRCRDQRDEKLRQAGTHD